MLVMMGDLVGFKGMRLQLLLHARMGGLLHPHVSTIQVFIAATPSCRTVSTAYTLPPKALTTRQAWIACTLRHPQRLCWGWRVRTPLAA